MVVVSITPEIALEKSRIYAGGLGVLEGDKFYAAGDIGLEYLVLSLFYRHGYAKVKIHDHGVSFEPEEQRQDFYEKLRSENELIVLIRKTPVYVRPWVYKYKTAKAVLFEATCPEWARKLTNRVYVEDSEEEKYMKYVLLAKSSAEYLKNRIGLEKISVVDLEESYTALLLYLLGLEQKSRIIIHTPGPWGHPVFPSSVLESEFGTKHDSPMINMTYEAVKRLSEVIVVSKKQKDIIPKIFPNIEFKTHAITNGIYLERWMDPALLNAWNKGNVNVDLLRNTRRRAKKELELFLKKYKEDIIIGDKIVVTWARRLSRYKRPYFIAEFIEVNPGLDVIYVLAGKPHPKDPDGFKYLTWFRDLSLKLKNVIYISDFDLDIVKLLVRSSDLWLFTPFSGWEACGTSYMKALANGVPVVSSRDGGVVEIIEEGHNGWLFGEDLREFINIYEDPRAKAIDERDFKEFTAKLIDAVDVYYNDVEKYWIMALNAWRDTPNRVNIKNALREYYFKKPISR